jgi:hypothetical protein
LHWRKAACVVSGATLDAGLGEALRVNRKVVAVPGIITPMAAMMTIVMTDSNHRERETETPRSGISVSRWLLFGRGNRTVPPRLASPAGLAVSRVSTAAFACSRGLARVVEVGEPRMEIRSGHGWQTSLTGAGRTGSILLRLAHHGAGDPAMRDIAGPRERGRGFPWTHRRDPDQGRAYATASPRSPAISI